MLKSTFTQWQVFNAVIDHGGYLQAAEKLNRSHSSLHHAVQKLQEQLGVTLLTVEGKKVRPTAIGEVMRRRSAQLLVDAKDLEQLAQTARAGWETEIIIAVDGIYPKALLMDVLGQFNERGHGTRLKLDSVILNGAAEAIRTAAADMVISPIVPQGYLGTALLSVSLIPLARHDHPLVTTQIPVEPRDLHRSLQIVISDRMKSEGRDAVGWLKSEQRWTVSDFHQARDVILSGSGFCWLPIHMVEDDIKSGALRPLNMRERLERVVPLSLVIPTPEKLGPAGKLLADLFRASADRERA